MKKYEIAALSETEMKERIKECKEQIANIKFNKAIEPPTNPMILRNLRKDIARMKTLLRQKELAAEKEKKA
ncbi:MAG: 50S ribosomal protein L29 [Candidatus Thermochlorobacter sp.]